MQIEDFTFSQTKSIWLTRLCLMWISCVFHQILTKMDAIKKKLKSLSWKTLRRFQRYLRTNIDGFQEVTRLSLGAIASKLADKYNIEEVSSMVKKVKHLKKPRSEYRNTEHKPFFLCLAIFLLYWTVWGEAWQEKWGVRERDRCQQMAEDTSLL